MTRIDVGRTIVGGAIGGAAAIGGLWIGRNLLRQPVTAAKPYDQAATITDTLGRLRALRKAGRA